ncbi:hypothetical protein Tco_0975154 [Tanacetum coccineum]|uniref:Uncharacterized protein n=1 Tax=Tanacetum coccineum TaxID=301880 RepID=A0ABQ5EDR7_9ASTR
MTPYEEPTRVLHSTRKLFKTMSLDYSSSPKFDLFSDPEYQFEEENTETIGEPTMEDGTNGEDAMEHIEKFRKIVDSLNITNVTHDQLRLSIFPISLIRAAGKWLMDETDSFITTWVNLTGNFVGEYYPPSRTGIKMGANKASIKVKWDPTNIEFRNWLASKFRNHKIMDRYTKNAIWEYWRRGDDEEVIIDDELSNPGDENLMKENEIAQIFRIDTNIFHFETPL